eukprot:sb/3474638/
MYLTLPPPQVLMILLLVEMRRTQEKLTKQARWQLLKWRCKRSVNIVIPSIGANRDIIFIIYIVYYIDFYPFSNQIKTRVLEAAIARFHPRYDLYGGAIPHLILSSGRRRRTGYDRNLKFVLEGEHVEWEISQKPE